MTSHLPELILNNFSTRLGHVVGRMIASLFPHVPEFKGRQVVTFHNQRDFIFFRRHRYMFKQKSKASQSQDSDEEVKPVSVENRCHLQELGPQFTMKLQSLQKGIHDPKHGDYEWKHHAELDTSRRRFFL